MKRTLEALITALAITGAGCVKTQNFLHDASASAVDGKYDSVDDYINPEDPPKLIDASYMVISESKYKDPDGKLHTLHSLGTAVVYKDIGSKTYLATANHIVENDKILYDFFGGKYERLSEQFYLLEDDEVDSLHRLLKILEKSTSSDHLEDTFYAENTFGGKKETLNPVTRTSDEIKIILDVLKPKKITTVIQNETIDLALISVPRLKHIKVPYSIGSAEELQTQNLVYVVGWPLGLIENVTRGYITSVNDTKLGSGEAAFITDAAVSPGNSGGGIFAVRDGKLELVGITSAMYNGGNDLYRGVKIDALSELFNGDSINCAKGWKCNLSMSYELKL